MLGVVTYMLVCYTFLYNLLPSEQPVMIRCVYMFSYLLLLSRNQTYGDPDKRNATMVLHPILFPLSPPLLTSTR